MVKKIEPKDRQQEILDDATNIANRYGLPVKTIAVYRRDRQELAIVTPRENTITRIGIPQSQNPIHETTTAVINLSGRPENKKRKTSKNNKKRSKKN